MTAYRSLTDDHLAAKHDPMPCVRESDGMRGDLYMEPDYEPGQSGAFGRLEPLLYDPRIETIPSRDPLPWLHTHLSDDNCDEIGDRMRTNNGVGNEWSPAPEYARPPVNPILTQVRADIHEDGSPWVHSPEAWLEQIDRWGATGGNPDANSQHVAHARAVLTRLAALA